ncbi:serine hydrolase domain-containing protein [Streptomyces sp. NPDC014733]|uniref:serine hydrolase domain-containing protein n=1 Tax=Streptomyces sp. NPDC014733 TaxID=3364885 RepID=UPI0036F50C47
MNATTANWATPPHHRDGLHQVDRLIACAEIAAAPGTPRTLTEAAIGLDWAALKLPVEENRSVPAAEFLKLTRTDAILVLRGDEVLFEDYRGDNTATTRHIVMSISKSFCGMLAGTLVAEGRLDTEDTVATIVPELSGTSFGQATVRQLLDMTAAPHYDMTYLDPASEANAGDRAAGWRPRTGDDAPGTRAFLAGLRGAGEHGARFQYCSGTTDALSWTLERAAGEDYRSLMESRIWSRIGAEANAYITVDPLGTPYACAGMGMRLRDLARFGRLVLNGGWYDGTQVIPREWIAQTRAGGDFTVPEDSASGTYRNQWWIPDSRQGSFYAVGIFGQYLWLDPENDVVVAKFSCCDSPVDHRPDHIPALAAIARAAAQAGR